MEMITFYFYFRKTFTIPLSTLYKAAALYNMLPNFSNSFCTIDPPLPFLRTFGEYW